MKLLLTEGLPGPIGPQGIQGETGLTGPNVVEDSTATSLTGILKGDGHTVEVAVAGTDYTNPAQLAAAVAVETLRATGVENTIAASVTTETNARISGDNTNAAAVVTEAGLRLSGDNVNAAAVVSEALLRANDDLALGTRIDDEQIRAEGAESALGTRIDDETDRATGAEALITSALSQAIAALQWRTYCRALTSDPRLFTASDGVVLSTLLPFSDDYTPVAVLADFQDGDYVISSNGAASKVFVVRIVSGVKQLTTAGILPLAANNAFIVDNDLPMHPSTVNAYALYSFNGSGMVRIGTTQWNFATGITLEFYSHSAGIVVTGDTVQEAVSKLDGNIRGEITRATGVESTHAAQIASLQSSDDGLEMELQWQKAHEAFYTEVAYDGSHRMTDVDIYVDNTKAVHLFNKHFTYTLTKCTSVLVTRISDAKTLLKSLTYDSQGYLLTSTRAVSP